MSLELCCLRGRETIRNRDLTVTILHFPTARFGTHEISVLPGAHMAPPNAAATSIRQSLAG